MSIFQFLNLLDEKRISYRLERVRDSIMVEIAAPGERWEVEFFEDGRIETERFATTAEIRGEESLAELFEKLGESRPPVEPVACTAPIRG